MLLKEGGGRGVATPSNPPLVLVRDQPVDILCGKGIAK